MNPREIHKNAPHLAQINGAIRAVAADEGLPVIDYELLALAMPDMGGLFLEDGFHVNGPVLFHTMLNVLLNEYAAHIARRQADALRFRLPLIRRSTYRLQQNLSATAL